ncbi:MAG: family 10 glycosylhydrolase [Thermoplasmatota archaeon]
MRTFLRAAVFIVLFFLMVRLPVDKVLAEDDMTRYPVPGADYPQQDGGSDERLFQYRSMWLEGYQIINHSEVQKVIKVARDSNINCVTPLINAHSLGTFYNSSFHPRYRDLTWDFDPLMDLIREAHKYNIHVMPWFHTMIDPYAISRNPEWGLVSNSGVRSGSWLNPSLPEVQDYLADVVYQLFRDYPLDGIHLDACRYPSSAYGYDSYSIQLYYDEGWNDFNAFRREQVTKCMISIHDSISRIRPYVWIGADIGNSYSSRQNSWFQDSENWSEMGKIDFVTPMIYTLNSASLESILLDNINRHSCPVVCGNYVYVPEDPYYGTVPDEETGMAVLQNQTERAINAGALGTCFFAYKFLADHPYYHRSLREGVFSQKALCPLMEQTDPVRTNEWNFDMDQDREGWRVTGMGNQYPTDGVWSISNVKEPKLMSPLLNLVAPGINVLELSMKTESREGNVTVFWSDSGTVFNDPDSVTFPVIGNGDWNLYSIHMDRSERWNGNIAYVRIVPSFSLATNITIDLMRITWMPDCIKAWAYLGPFTSGSGEGLLEREFIDNEAGVKPRLGDVMGGREWKRYWIDRDQVDLRFVLGHVRDAVSYSHVYIRSDRDRILEMRHGNSDGARIWLNGEEVFHFDGWRKVAADQNVTFVSIRKGINTLLIKQVVYDDDNSFYMRFTDPGNVSVNDLEFFEELPLLGPPVITDDPEEWTGESDMTIFWEPPKDPAGLDHYIWKLDQGPEVRTDQKQAPLEDLSEGVHQFSVRCVDNLGFKGEEDRISFGVDTETPIISAPVPGSPMMTEPTIRWDWDLLYSPPSGISRYIVTVESWRRESTEKLYPVVDHPVYDTYFILDDGINDGYMYTIHVKAVSGSGRTFEAGSVIDVLLDLTPPSRPTGLVLGQLGYGSREYRLSWYPSMENTEGGISHYEVWWKVGAGDWSVAGTVQGTNTTLERPLGLSFEVKVRSMDLSSHYSDFSNPVLLENQEPVPLILLEEKILAGTPLHFHTQTLVDPDGVIESYEWSLDGKVLSTLDHLDLTLGPGSYELVLVVVDDQGAAGTDFLKIEVQEPSRPELNTTVSGWLADSSLVTIDHSPVDVPHYNNETVYLEKNDTGEDGLVLKEFLMNSMLLMTAVPLVIVMVMIILYLLVGEVTGLRSETFETSVNGKAHEDAAEIRKEELRSFMDRQAMSAGGSRPSNVQVIEGAGGGVEEVRPGISDMIRTSIIGKALDALDNVIEEEDWEEVEWDEDGWEEEIEEWEEVEE